MQKIHQFKLLTLFSYQIILPVVFFVNNEKKLQSEKEPLGQLWLKKNVLVRYINFGSKNISIKMEVA